MLNNNIIIKKYGSSTELIIGQNIVNLATRIKKIETASQIKVVVNTIERHTPLNYEEEMVKFDLFILEMHLDRSWIFKKQNGGLYSEADHRHKFWSYVLEKFFGRRSDVVSRWDTR